jgi:hypothetical protein
MDLACASANGMSFGCANKQPGKWLFVPFALSERSFSEQLSEIVKQGRLRLLTRFNERVFIK